MVPVLSNERFRQLEQRFLQRGTVDVLELMERAGQACAQRILEMEASGHPGSKPTYWVLAGMGNNGGDGLVIARCLKAAGRAVRTYVVEHSTVASPAQQVVLERALAGNVAIERVSSVGPWLQPSANDVIIDAMLGSGVDRPLEGFLADLVELVNSHPGWIVAIDLPTGTMERSDIRRGAQVKATHTLTFEVPRQWMFFPETGEAAGRWELVPIGLDHDLLQEADRFADLVETRDVRSLLRTRLRFAHKGTNGHAYLLAGSGGYLGAAVLATRGCARSGAGLITVHAPVEVIRAVIQAVPDAMSTTDPGGRHITCLPDLEKATAIGIGPGLGSHEETERALGQLLASWKGPLVIDADALNILARQPALLAQVPEGAILTPHPKEMDRLLGSVCVDGFDRAQRTRRFAVDHACFIVLKGAYSMIATPDGRAFFNPTGNEGMAKGGSGDVLTGLLTGVLAQGYAPLEACMLATYLHGAAGDLAANVLGTDAMRASDLVDELPAAWMALRSR